MALEIQRAERSLLVGRRGKHSGEPTYRTSIKWAVVDHDGSILTEFDTPREARAFSRGVEVGEERLRAKARAI